MNTVAAAAEDVALTSSRLDSDALVTALVAERVHIVDWLSGWLRSRADAEDLAQEALLVACLRRAELRDSARACAWLRRIAHNMAVDLLRRRKVELRVHAEWGGLAESERAIEDEPCEPTQCLCLGVCAAETAHAVQAPLSPARGVTKPRNSTTIATVSRLASERNRRLDDMRFLPRRLLGLEKLRPAYRDVLRQADLEGVAIADVARRQATTANNVRVRLHRAAGLAGAPRAGVSSAAAFRRRRMQSLRLSLRTGGRASAIRRVGSFARTGVM